MRKSDPLVDTMRHNSSVTEMMELRGLKWKNLHLTSSNPPNSGPPFVLSFCFLSSHFRMGKCTGLRRKSALHTFHSADPKAFLVSVTRELPPDWSPTWRLAVCGRDGTMASLPWLPSNLVARMPTTSPSLSTGASAPSNKEECVSTCQHLPAHDFTL